MPKGKFRLPESDELTEYFFIEDEAFPLSINFIRPFSERNLDDKRRIFNYKLSRARTIENAFGVLVSWRVLQKPICMQPDTIDKIILSTVCLHNFLKSFEEQQSATNRVYCLQNFVDNDIDEIITYGAWRADNIQIQNIPPCNARRATIEAYQVRKKLADYFLTLEEEVRWQYDYVRKGQNSDLF